MRKTILITLFLGLALLFPLVVSAQTAFNGNLLVTGTLNSCAGASGSDAYTCNLDPAITAYVSRQCYTFRADVANTGPASINFNSVGTINIKKVLGSLTTDLVTGDIRLDQIVNICYDGTNMQMQSTLGSMPSVINCGNYSTAAGDTLGTSVVSMGGQNSTDIGVTETAFAKTCVIPANAFAAGTRVEFKALIAETTIASPITALYKVRLTNASGTEMITSTAGTMVASLTYRPQNLHWNCYGTAAPGAAVNVACLTEETNAVTAAGTFPAWTSIFNTSAAFAATAATNGALTFVVTITFGATTDGTAVQLLALKAFIWP